MGAVLHRDFLGLVAVEHQVQFFLGQVFDRCLGGEAVGLRHRLHQADIPPAGGAAPGPRGDGALRQGEVPVGYDQVRVDGQLVAQPGALGAGPVGTVEAEGPRLYLGQADPARGARELLGKDQRVAFFGQRLHDAVALPQAGLHRFGHPAEFDVGAYDQAVDHQLDVMPLLLVQVQVVGLVQHVGLAVDADADEPRLAGRLEHVLMFALLAAHFGGQQRDAAALC